MKGIVFAVPGDLATPTGGYAYDRRIIAELSLLGLDVTVLDLGDGFPRPGLATRRQAMARLAAVPGDVAVVVDGLAFGALPEASDIGRTHCVIALVHHPLALESGLAEAAAEELRRSERAALAAARRVIATSPATARLLVSDYAVAPDRLAVVTPGTDRVSFARGSRGAIPALLAVGAVVPRKGYDVLVAALAALSDLPWRLAIAGDRGRDLAEAARLDAAIAARRLGARIAVLGAVSPDQLAELYDGADLFVLASRFEGYGMVYAEAIAHGLPVIGTLAGAIPETVPLGAGVLVPPEDASALAAALRRLIADPAARTACAAAARNAAARLPSWRDSARLFAAAIEAAR